MQTPMQPFFNPQMVPPGAPGRGHRAAQSIAQLAAVGIHPPFAAVTPMGGHFPRQSMSGFPGAVPPHNPFPNRNRRQLSIGGPPKAILGGPQRKLSPNPLPGPSSAPSAGVSGSTTPAGAASVNPVKAKKITVNLPKETIPSEEEGVAATLAVFARIPLRPEEVVEDTNVRYPELTTCEEFPPEQFRHEIPSTVDVFLPGKVRDVTHSVITCVLNYAK